MNADSTMRCPTAFLAGALVLVSTGRSAAHGPSERGAFEKARPVFEKHCARCHTTTGKKAKPKALEHFTMDRYPFGGHHATTIHQEIRAVLGATGKKPTMPSDDRGAVTGAELASILAWADAFERAHPGARSAPHTHKAGEPAHLHEPAAPPAPSPPPSPAPSPAAGPSPAPAPPSHAHPAPPVIPGPAAHVPLAAHAEHPSAPAAWLVPYAVPREMLIPGTPGMPGGFHFMLNTFAHPQNPGLSGYTIDNPGAERKYDAGRTRPWVTGNWVMGYGRHARGWVEGLVMFNFEPLTIGNAGIPELGQSGEGLWDVQHAHQLVHQAVLAVHPLAGTAGGSLSSGREGTFDLVLFGGQGSATIGPPIFMHRASSPGPTVPRKHHKGENPHETFPLLGAGFRYGATWLEVSAFNGQDLGPMDSRFYPHPATPESFAARLRHTIGSSSEAGPRGVELQASGLRLRGHGHHGEVWQASASVYAWGTLRGWRIDALADWALDVPSPGRRAHGALVELAGRDPSGRNVLWVRSELNEREEPAGGAGHGSVSSPWLFQTAGFEHILVASRRAGMQIGLFAEATHVSIPDELTQYPRKDAVTLNAGLHLFGMWMLDGDLRRIDHRHHGQGGQP